VQGGSGSVRLLSQEAPPAEQAAGFTREAAVAAAHGLHAHHTYDAPADPYSCDFASVPGAWTAAPLAGSTADQSAEGNALFGTAIAQATIWRHQHPTDCGRARFLLHRPQARRRTFLIVSETLGRAQKKKRPGRKQLSLSICAEGAWLWWWRLDSKALPVRLERKSTGAGADLKAPFTIHTIVSEHQAVRAGAQNGGIGGQVLGAAPALALT